MTAMPDMTAVSTTGTSNACKARMPRRTRKDGANQIPTPLIPSRREAPRIARRTPIRLSSIPTQRGETASDSMNTLTSSPVEPLSTPKSLLTELNMGCGAYISV